MRAMVCEAYGSPANLVFRDVPDPVPAPGEVAIEVHAAGVNFPDVLLVQRRYQIKPAPPFSPGVEAAGVVVAAGEGVAAPRPGDRVSALVMGGFAERVVARADATIPLPATVDFDTAAAMTMTYGTAYHALIDRAVLQPREWVFVTGGGGGVGLAAIAIAAAAGARVAASAGSDEKRAAARAAGAELAIDAGAADAADQLKRATGGGIDVALDTVGGAQFDAALRAARWGARLLIVGFAGGTIPQIPANRVLLRSLDVRGVYWGDWIAREPARNRANFARLFAWLETGVLRRPPATTYAFGDAPRAIADLMERRLTGKAVVRVRAQNGAPA